MRHTEAVPSLYPSADPGAHSAVVSGDESHSGVGRRVAIVVALAVACVLGPSILAVVVARQDPAGFWPTAVLFGVILLFVLRSAARWIRPSRRARASDFVIPVGIPVIMASALYMLREIAARENGILDSAWPRVEQGIAMPIDYPYLISTWLLLALIAIGLLHLLLLAISHLSARETVEHR